MLSLRWSCVIWARVTHLHDDTRGHQQHHHSCTSRLFSSFLVSNDILAWFGLCSSGGTLISPEHSLCGDTQVLFYSLLHFSHPVFFSIFPAGCLFLFAVCVYFAWLSHSVPCMPFHGNTGPCIKVKLASFCLSSQWASGWSFKSNFPLMQRYKTSTNKINWLNKSK